MGKTYFPIGRGRGRGSGSVTNQVVSCSFCWGNSKQLGTLRHSLTQVLTKLRDLLRFISSLWIDPYPISCYANSTSAQWSFTYDLLCSFRSEDHLPGRPGTVETYLGFFREAQILPGAIWDYGAAEGTEPQNHAGNLPCTRGKMW